MSGPKSMKIPLESRQLAGDRFPVGSSSGQGRSTCETFRLDSGEQTHPRVPNTPLMRSPAVPMERADHQSGEGATSRVVKFGDFLGPFRSEEVLGPRTTLQDKKKTPGSTRGLLF